MIGKKVYLTKEGLEKLKAELEELKNVRRPKVIERIRASREFGDLSENAEYESARNEQSFIEGRIAEIEELLKNVEVIENRKNKNIVDIGSRVQVEVDGEKYNYMIVGSAEANPTSGLISNESAVGRALLGKKVGEIVEVETPGGVTKYQIKSIE